MQQQVGHAQDVRQMFLLDAGEAVLDGALVSVSLGLLAQVLDGAHEEAAGAAGGVHERLAEARVDLIDNELRDGARSIQLAGVAGGLEVPEKFCADVLEEVASGGVVEVAAVYLVDDWITSIAVL